MLRCCLRSAVTNMSRLLLLLQDDLLQAGGGGGQRLRVRRVRGRTHRHQRPRGRQQTPGEGVCALSRFLVSDAEIVFSRFTES